MKKILYIVTMLLLAAGAKAQKACCPQFRLVADMQPCDTATKPYVPPGGNSNGDTGGKPDDNTDSCDLRACKHTMHTYLVLPLKTGYSYTWSVSGGIAAAQTGNPMKVTWGNGDAGIIKVYISSQDGTCRDTIVQHVCLQDAPTANFTFNPAGPVCLNQVINFNNTSVGAVSYYWDFGDGASSSLTSPSHNYTTPGTYTITLAVNNSAGHTDGAYEQETDCGCRDTIRKTITIRGQSGIEIVPGCKQMLCKGDTASYCTTNQCGSYNWAVTGGHILGSNNSECITVVWDGSYPATVTMSGNCGNACGNSSTISVPVLYPAMPVQGNATVCPSSFGSYVLPAMPGTFYKWTVSGGGTIQGADSNTNVVNVLWGNTPGSYTITCNYHNPATGCSGTANITVRVLPPYKIAGPVKFCVGNPFSFTANGSGNWVINPAAGHTPATFMAGSAINGMWNLPGSYTVTATPTSPASFCSFPGVLNVVVVDTPKLNAITGPAVVCPGSMQLYKISSNMNDGMFNWTITGGFVASNMGAHHDSVMIQWSNAGPYQVSVTQVVNGCQGSPKVLNVSVFAAPTIQGPASACMDNTATYTSPGIAPPGGFTWTLSNSLGTITSGQGTNTITVQWNGSNAPSPTCNVNLTTCAGNASLTVNIFTAPPVAIAKSNTLCSPAGITLTASPGGAAGYAWQHNGIAMSSTANPQTVTQPGLYTVTITNTNGCKSTGNINIPVEKLSVTASVSTTDKLIWGCYENINAVLHAIPSAPGYCYKWFKDGAVIAGATTALYTAQSAGSYWCQVSLCNTSCIAVTDTIKISRNCGGGGNCNPNYTINVNHTACNPIAFTGSASPAAAAGAIHWIFGDGKDGYGSSITHQYKDTGSYMVCAVFGGNGYCEKDTCFIVHVTTAANFSAVVNCGAVNFTNLSKSTIPVTSYSWAFPGGTPSSSTLQTPPAVAYAAGGLQNATLTVSNGVCTVSYTDTFTIYNVNAAIIAPSPVCASTYAPFSAASTGSGVTYQWDFGDGYISNLQNTGHAYTATGPKTITLVVTGSNGCTKTVTQQVNVLQPVTAYIGTDKYICPGGSVQLTAPPNFTSHQWYKDGVIIAGATSVNYTATAIGDYYVTVANGAGCIASSNHINVLYSSLPVADIQANTIQCTGNMPNVQNAINESGVNYTWSAAGPATVSFSPANNYHPSVNITGQAPGDYQFILAAENTATHCKASDTLCITVVQSPAVTVNAPAGPLCEGQVYTFIANATPNINPGNYYYHWSNGFTGNPMATGKPGGYSVTVVNPSGCSAMAFAGSINSKPDVSLFPVGCDTLCWTDTLHFPLPQPAPLGYNITWYDDDGTAVTNAGAGPVLPLANLQPGIHHLYATVSFSGSCADTTGRLDLYIKDCTLPPPCDNCTGLFQSASLQTGGNANSPGAYQVVNNNLVITILKPVKEVRVSLADLQYHWKDSACNNCKVQMIERGCLFAKLANQPLGTLLPDSSTVINLQPNAPVNNCRGELVWKNGTALQPGTYSIPLQLSLPTQTGKCQLIIDKFCVHVTVVDEDCKTCDKWVCKSDTAGACQCSIGNVWTSLYLLPKKPGIAKPQTQILCNSTLTGVVTGVPYTLSGVYHCQGNCLSIKNEIVVYNQLSQIIYTHVGTQLNETLEFPAKGMYTVELAATCGLQRCICSFKTYVTDSACTDCGNTTNGCTGCTTITGKIDSVIHTILPPGFTGEVLVSKNDTTIYETYTSHKDTVTPHTAFDLASITKTFTAMAILKLMENGKLNVDDDVTKYLPEFPIQGITIKMLLSHKSGLEDYLVFMDASDWDKTKTLTNKDLLQFIVNNKKKVVINEPGKAFYYSNTNFALLALVIEKISGMAYKDYLEETFFKPLQMNDTYVLGLGNFATATKSYYKNGTAYKLRYLDLVYGDKDVYSTVRDLKKWDKALHEGKLFKKSTLDLAYAPTSPVSPFVSNYGLGWKKIVTDQGKEIIYHTGWWAGNRSLLIRLLKENVMIAVVSNNNFTNIADIRKLCDLFGNYQQSNKTIEGF
ncbi:MAG TPA: serine hydrolase [Chitinophagaceae bacterium]|nr:serine hydrolase [Chitinophagaceae bacterium]